MADAWIEACGPEDIEIEDLTCLTLEGRFIAVYRTEDNRFYATDGHCTHEQVSLDGGLVMGNTVECPKHNGRFDIRTGEAKGAPVCVNLASYAVKLEGGRLFVQLG